MPRRLLPALFAALGVLVTGHLEAAPRPSLSGLPLVTLQPDRAHRASIARVDMPPRHAYPPVVADFNRDGLDDVFIGGHEFSNLRSGLPRHSDRIFYWQRNRLVPGEFTFQGGADRHGCTALDVDRDAVLDLFCAAGADRGRGGDLNELLMGKYDGTFKRTPDHAAQYGSGRSRVAVDLDVNADGWRDIVVSVFGERPDGKPNATTLFVNRRGYLEARTSCLAGDWGGRCMAAADLDRDGRDDIVACGPGRGLRAFSGLATRQCRSVPLLRQDMHVEAVSLADFNGSGRPDLALAVNRGNRAGVVLLHDPQLSAGSLSFDRKRAVELDISAAFPGCMVYDMSVGAVGSDAKPALVLSLSDAGERTRRCAPVAEVILPGPGFGRYLRLDAGVHKRPTMTAIVNGAVLRVSSAPGWAGLADLVFLNKAQSAP